MHEEQAIDAQAAVTAASRNRMSCIVVERCDLATLKVGDHLKVMRRHCDVVPYAHHGIYEGDGHVIDFGSGSWDGATRKTLAEFRGKSPAVKVVQHGRGTLATGYLFPAVEPEEIVARARFLLANSRARVARAEPAGIASTTSSVASPETRAADRPRRADLGPRRADLGTTTSIPRYITAPTARSPQRTAALYGTRTRRWEIRQLAAIAFRAARCEHRVGGQPRGGSRPPLPSRADTFAPPPTRTSARPRIQHFALNL
jgi:Lecithin retinol acyltransferase